MEFTEELVSKIKEMYETGDTSELTVVELHNLRRHHFPFHCIPFMSEKGLEPYHAGLPMKLVPDRPGREEGKGNTSLVRQSTHASNYVLIGAFIRFHVGQRMIAFRELGDAANVERMSRDLLLIKMLDLRMKR